MLLYLSDPGKYHLRNMNDKISELIISIKNAGMAGNKTTEVPASKLKKSVLMLLKKEGYITDFEEKGKDVTKAFVITIAYKKDGTPKISDVKRVSKLSRRSYVGYRDLRPVKYGHGLAVLSTPLGVISGSEARAKKVGGEVLFTIW